MEPSKLSRDEVIRMADIMSDAFLNHSNWVKRIKSDSKRKKLINNLFTVLFLVINEYGYIFSVSKEKDTEVIGYITYMDPSDTEQISLRRVIKTNGLKYVFRFLFGLNPKILKSMIDYMRIYNTHKRDEDNVIHLYSTGIMKIHRGRGVMGKGLRSSFQYFFDLGYKKISLETSDQSNIAIYEKLGFKITEVVSKKKQTMYFLDLERVE